MVVKGNQSHTHRNQNNTNNTTNNNNSTLVQFAEEDMTRHCGDSYEASQLSQHPLSNSNSISNSISQPLLSASMDRSLQQYRPPGRPAPSESGPDSSRSELTCSHSVGPSAPLDSESTKAQRPHMVSARFLSTI